MQHATVVQESHAGLGGRLVTAGRCSSARVSNVGVAFGSGFAIQRSPFLLPQNHGTPEGDVRGACSSGVLSHTKYMDRPVHLRLAGHSSGCRAVIPVSAIPTYSAMLVQNQ